MSYQSEYMPAGHIYCQARFSKDGKKPSDAYGDSPASNNFVQTRCMQTQKFGPDDDGFPWDGSTQYQEDVGISELIICPRCALTLSNYKQDDSNKEFPEGDASEIIWAIEFIIMEQQSDGTMKRGKSIRVPSSSNDDTYFGNNPWKDLTLNSAWKTKHGYTSTTRESTKIISKVNPKDNKTYYYFKGLYRNFAGGRDKDDNNKIERWEQDHYNGFLHWGTTYFLIKDIDFLHQFDKALRNRSNTTQAKKYQIAYQLYFYSVRRTAGVSDENAEAWADKVVVINNAHLRTMSFKPYSLSATSSIVYPVSALDAGTYNSTPYVKLSTVNPDCAYYYKCVRNMIKNPSASVLESIDTSEWNYIKDPTKPFQIKKFIKLDNYYSSVSSTYRIYIKQSDFWNDRYITRNFTKINPAKFNDSKLLYLRIRDLIYPISEYYGAHVTSQNKLYNFDQDEIAKLDDIQWLQTWINDYKKNITNEDSNIVIIDTNEALITTQHRDDIIDALGQI